VKAALVFALAILGLSLPIAAPAQDGPSPSREATAHDTGAPTRNWKLDLGFSYLATTGNSDTRSLGFNAHYIDEWGAWGLDATAGVIRASEDGVTTAENYDAAVRASRKLRDRVALTAGLAGRKDRFAGIDLRTELDLAVKWSLLERQRWSVSALLGPSWVREDPVGGTVDSHLGAIAQLNGEYDFSENASATARLTYLPDLETSSDYRTEAELGVQAALNRRLALKLGYLWLFDNQPVPGFEKSDTRTTASLVVKLGTTKKGD